MAVDPTRIRKTLAFLLRHRPDVGHLELDDAGWCSVERVTRAVCRLQKVQLSPDQVAQLASTDPTDGFQVEQQRIRARSLPRKRSRYRLPDILYLPTTVEQMERSRHKGRVSRGQHKNLRLFTSEHRAWLAAHRSPRGIPAVLYVDALRLHRAHGGLRKVRRGMYTARHIPARHVLNLKPGFGVQVSAGGFIVRRRGQGPHEVALIRVRRRSGVTWEVAKGKLEPGETPEAAARREIAEEMGIDVPLEQVRDLGWSHYGFTTPGGEPRLKVLHLFVFFPAEDCGDFEPSAREGIEEVRFFEPDEAVRVIVHGSLRKPIRQLRSMLRELEQAEE